MSPESCVCCHRRHSYQSANQKRLGHVDTGYVLLRVGYVFGCDLASVAGTGFGCALEKCCRNCRTHSVAPCWPGQVHRRTSCLRHRFLALAIVDCVAHVLMVVVIDEVHPFQNALTCRFPEVGPYQQMRLHEVEPSCGHWLCQVAAQNRLTLQRWTGWMRHWLLAGRCCRTAP